MRFDQLTHADRFDLDEEGVGVPPAFCDNDLDVHAPHVYSAINGRIYRCWGMTAEDLAEIEAEASRECEHGLSASLCNGPMHW